MQTQLKGIIERRKQLAFDVDQWRRSTGEVRLWIDMGSQRPAIADWLWIEFGLLEITRQSSWSAFFHEEEVHSMVLKDVLQHLTFREVRLPKYGDVNSFVY